MDHRKRTPLAPVKLLVWAMVLVGVLILLGVGAFEFAAIRAGAQAERLQEDALPAADRLTAMHGALGRLDTALDRAMIELAEGQRPNLPEIADCRADLSVALRAYEQMLRDPAEQPYVERIRQAERHVDEVLQRLASALEHGEIAVATRLDYDGWRLASDRLDDAVRETLLFKIQQSDRHAAVIRQLSGTFIWVGIILVVVLFFLGSAATGIAATSINRQLRHDEARAAELEMFAGRVAHDLLSPLSAAQLALQLLAKGADPRVASLSRTGLSAVRRVANVVSGLFDFAASGGQADRTARAPAQEAVASVLEELAAQARTENIELGCAPIPDRVLACRSAVVSIILANLVRNSIKYMGEATRRQIDISAAEERGLLRFQVADTGPGLEPGLEKTIFEPYVRGRSDRSGMGLGLATVKRLVEAHGGQVGVRPSEGGGATFWFTLPLAMDAPEEPGEGPRVAEERRDERVPVPPLAGSARPHLPS